MSGQTVMITYMALASCRNCLRDIGLLGGIGWLHMPAVFECEDGQWPEPWEPPHLWRSSRVQAVALDEVRIRGGQ